MNFLRLLTAGRSWEGKASHAAQYRMRTENLLPKFVSKKNPFASSVSGAATASVPSVKTMPEVVPAGKLETKALFAGEEPVKAGALAVPVVQAATNTVKPVKIAKTAKTAKATVSAPELGQSKPETAATPKTRKTTKPRTNWLKMLNPLSYFPAGGAKAGRPVGSRGARPAVQTELSLDKVRVMRNELNDADIEIVPGRLMGMPSGASPVLVHPEQGGGTWGRLASRFLRAEHAEHAETQ